MSLVVYKEYSKECNGQRPLNPRCGEERHRRELPHDKKRIHEGDSGLLEENWLNSLQLNIINKPMIWAWDMAGLPVTFLAETNTWQLKGEGFYFGP